MTVPDQELTALLGALQGSEVCYFPVRHHSPACAWHLRHWIREHRPVSVLVEGPRNFTPLIPLILHEKILAPFAIYANFIDRAGRLMAAMRASESSEGKPDAGPQEPLRFAGYYPFCEHSPELIALRAGREVGARLRFIDLTYPEKVLSEARSFRPDAAPRVESLQAEPVLAYSEYVGELARKTGCRDQNDLWDHLFEANFANVSTETFRDRVAAYCLMARRGCAREALEAEGTLARERAMAAAIDEELQQLKAVGIAGPILVVTGGIHTAALPFLVDSGVMYEPGPTFASDEAQVVLVRYSFPQLDALNGYASGMPSPRYYADLWGQLDVTADNPLLEVAGRFVVEIGRKTREDRFPFPLSTADEIAALQQSRHLADLRGHPGPTREDLLDGLRSCFVKGAMDSDGSVLFALVREVLSGNQVGDVPPEAGVPPLVTDFRQAATHHRLKIDDTLPRQATLDIYRNAAHRATSHFFRRVEFLGAPFARLVGGPDFVAGRGTHLIQEHWEYAWSPATEGALIEASVYGATLEEAAASRLQQAVQQLDAEGRSRSTAPAVQLLVAGCQMGLHRTLGRLVALIERNVAEDPAFISLVTGIGQLVLLCQAREPLEAHDLAAVPILARTAYRRACALTPDLANTSEEEARPVLGGMARLREVSATDVEEVFDRALLLDAFRLLLQRPNTNATIAGGAAGILFSEGELGEPDLLSLVVGYLQGTCDNPKTRTGFLQGLLAVCREVAWRLPGLLDSLTELFESWDDNEFVHTLPDLRLAFSALTPREVDRVAVLVAARLGKKDLGDLVVRGISPEEVQFNLRLQAAVREVLKREHLEEWLPNEAS
jgi:hypothetical protein